MKRIMKLVLFIIIGAVFMSGCGNTGIKGSVTPKQIIDSDAKRIGYYVSGEISADAVPGMIVVFQNGKGVVYRGEKETLGELDLLEDDEILELVKDREHYEGSAEILLYTEFLSNKVLMEQIDLVIENGVAYNVISWVIDVENKDYYKQGVELGDNTYYGYNLLNGDGTTKDYLIFRIDADNFSLEFDSEKTQGIKKEVVGGF